MNLKLNAERFTGEKYAELYNQNRPSPPQEIIDQTLNYLNKERANRIVDSGCGTGISTRAWSMYGDEIIGIEPSESMILEGKKATRANNIKYINNYGDNTGIEPGTADIVSCSQSFHWMEPKSTLKEINRILKKNGVLAIYDAIWPPNVNYEYESSYNRLFERVEKLTIQLDEKLVDRWAKNKHLENISESKYFKFLKESYYHKSESLDKNKFIGIALSQGGLEALLKRGYTEGEIGITQFKEEIKLAKKTMTGKMSYNYRVIYGIK